MRKKDKYNNKETNIKDLGENARVKSSCNASNNDVFKEWKYVKLAWCVVFINGYAFNGDDLDIENEIPVVRIGDIQNNLVNFDNCLKVSFNDELDRYRLKNNDIVIAMSGATTGKIAVIYGHVKSYINQRVGIIRSKYNSFIKYCLSCDNFSQYISLLSAGSAQPNISMSDILNFKIPFIDSKYYEKISIYLDKKCTIIDKYIETQNKIIEKLKEYKKSIITEAVTKGLDKNAKMKDSGVEWIGKIPEGWKTILLKYKFKIKKEIAGKEGYNILSVTQQGIMIKDISKNEGQIAMDYSKYQLVTSGDFIMNHMDLLTGWVDCSKYDGVTSPDYRVFVNIDLENCYNDYYKYIFQMCYKNKVFFGLGQGVSDKGRWRLQSDKFMNFDIPLPPYSEQIKIVNYINEKNIGIDKRIANITRIISMLLDFKKSLIYECVTGKRKVI